VVGLPVVVSVPARIAGDRRRRASHRRIVAIIVRLHEADGAVYSHPVFVCGDGDVAGPRTLTPSHCERLVIGVRR